MKKWLNLMIWITISGLIFNLSMFSQEKDILLGLKLYQGKRVQSDKTPEVISSFSLKPLYGGKLIPEDSYKKEQSEIKRIFHLDTVSVLAETKWGWGYDEKREHLFKVKVNGSVFAILTKLLKNKTFSIEVKLQKQKKWASLLKTGVLIPEQKSIVLGFEDSEKTPYFLSLRRGKDQAIGFVKKKGSLWVKNNDIPKIKKYVKPELTDKIIRRGKGGFVVAIAVLDTKGKVVGLERIRGDSLLSKAVKDAVLKWEYQPYLIDGKPVPVKFTIGVEFNLKDNSRWTVKSSNNERWTFIPSIWPTRGYISSSFGNRIHPLTKVKNFHTGIDISSRSGNKIQATADGIVKKVGYNDVKGRYIIIDHKNGYETEFTHLHKKVFVKEGESIKKGQKIAVIGNTGISTAPHLHYEVRKDGKAINPMDLIFD